MLLDTYSIEENTQIIPAEVSYNLGADVETTEYTEP